VILKVLRQKLRPLVIIGSFLGLTETVLGIGVLKVQGNIQVARAVFVMAFPVLVLIAFIAILWNRAHVLYPPSEYGDRDPNVFASAVKNSPVGKYLQLAKSVEKDPTDWKPDFHS